MSEEEREPRRFGLPRARKAVLDRLARAYADDDIELPEYERRTTAAEAAESVDELQRIMHDVPDFDLSGVVPRAAELSGQERPGSGEEERFVPESPGGAMPTALQLLGDREYGITDVREGVRIVSLLGDSTVDLRELREGERVVLSHVSLLGDLTILLPAGCSVRRHHLLLLGDENRREPRKKERKRLGIRGEQSGRDPRSGYIASGPPPIVELRGFKLLGDVTFIEV
ncbi:MAG: DUF1707 SHOCT-like domain-containing protein [Alkalispirochaetaceae bacterium]